MSEFVIVKKKNRKSQHIKLSQTSVTKDVDNDKDIQKIDINNFTKRLDNCIAEVEVSPFFTETFDIINGALHAVRQHKTSNSSTCNQIDEQLPTEVSSEDVLDEGSLNQSSGDRLSSVISRLEAVTVVDEPRVQLLSYGIGNFTTSLIARYQLAFFLSLRRKLKDHCQTCLVYDPVFSPDEEIILEKYSCQLISQNEEGCRECAEPTIAFMPHCGRPLYNNFLWKNLSTSGGQGLNKVVLIGNSFSQIVERTPKSLLRETGNYILKIQPFVKETSLPDSFILSDVFNDLAVHSFPLAAIQTIRSDIGSPLHKPEYHRNEEEFIRNKNVTN
ncbi:SRR1-like protein [Biomphalaria glabrata]|uniref:SRR1-like protein n=1 Tax=Biomphalaria glabrata TaxID=6526 RepID=A0A9W2YKK9_BIOGL|nr:SRR1-like protein [Biomphalaria glabrata]